MALQAGDTVKASYKTGTYIGRIEELGPQKAAVQILAVVKHPEQGDLHNPHNPDVAFFHQRRALAHREIALMPLSTVQPYTGEIPEYKRSLAAALRKDIEELNRMVEEQSERSRYARRALAELAQLEAEYSLA